MKEFDISKEHWGYLRETKEAAIKAGPDKDTGLHRTGLEEYLEVIYPEITDWIHDKTISPLPEGVKCRKRPDYRSESAKIIIEFDGIQHYTDPKKIRDDVETTLFYRSLGYEVIRIPWFIQLSNEAIETLFHRTVKEPMFNENIPCMGIKGSNPGILCFTGLVRMAEEFTDFPNQYKVNLEYLKSFDDDYITGAELLEKLYELATGDLLEWRILSEQYR